MLGKRIQRARKGLGLSLRDLGSHISLSHAAIKKYEDGDVVPSSDILLKLAQVLHVRVEYFFRPELFTLDNIQYRNHADIPKHHLDQIQATILDQIERRIELESLFPSSPIEKFSLEPKQINDYDHIEVVANKVREQWKLGLEPLPNLIDIIEEHGVKVFEVDNQLYPKFEGLSALINNMPVIVIGNAWPGDRQRFTLAHELGHLALDVKQHDLDEEKSCNRFAGAFLLPKETLINTLGEHRNDIDARELNLLKEEFGISMSCILHRAEECGIISKNLYDKIRAEFKERSWNKKEPGKQYPKQKTHIFQHMIFRALAEEYIGESKAAELMNISLVEFRSLRAMESQDVGSNQ